MKKRDIQSTSKANAGRNTPSSLKIKTHVRAGKLAINHNVTTR